MLDLAYELRVKEFYPELDHHILFDLSSLKNAVELQEGGPVQLSVLALYIQSDGYQNPLNDIRQAPLEQEALF